MRLIPTDSGTTSVSSGAAASSGPSVPTVSLSSKDLPSRMMPYPEGSTISYRPYQFSEVKKLSQSKLSREEQVALILGGIITSFPKEDLSYSDFLYISLLRKLSTLGAQKFQVMFQCPECGHAVNSLLSLQDVEFEDLSIPSLPVTVDFSFGSIQFSVLTVGGYLQLLQKKQEEDTVACLARMARAPFDQVYPKIAQSTGEDSRLLEEIDHLLYHGVKDRVVVCARKEPFVCGHEFSVSVDGGMEVLLIPFRGDSESLKSRIRFS